MGSLKVKDLFLARGGDIAISNPRQIISAIVGEIASYRIFSSLYPVIIQRILVHFIFR